MYSDAFHFIIHNYPINRCLSEIYVLCIVLKHSQINQHRTRY